MHEYCVVFLLLSGFDWLLVRRGGTIAELFSLLAGLSVRFLVLFLSLLSFNSYAVKISDLYRVSVEVDDQSEESRDQGVQWAFQQLLVKVSGYQEVLQNPVLIAASSDAQRYMQGFSYQKDSVDNQVYLQAWFSKALIVPLLKRAEAPIWGENRPLILNWLAVEATSTETNSSERLLVSESNPQWHGRLSRIFAERGLPTLWPTADLEDTTALPIEQLWWLVPDVIEQASLRYQADAVLAGRLNQSPEGLWQYEGFLKRGEDSLSILVSGETPQAALVLASAEVSHYFADRFAIKPSSADSREGVRVVINKVNDFTAYSQVLSYLNNITGVRNVEVAQIDRDNLQLYLALEGDWAKVQRIIRLDNKLVSLQDKEFEWAQ